MSTALKTSLIGVALAAMTFVALPAQAAPSLGTALDLDLGIAAPVKGGEQTTMMMKKSGGGAEFHYDDEDDWCADLSNKQIRKGMKKADFADIDFVKELKQHRVRVEALFEGDGWVYSMRIDRCDGEVDQIKPLYEAYDFDFDF